VTGGERDGSTPVVGHRTLRAGERLLTSREDAEAYFRTDECREKFDQAKQTIREQEATR
jgi:hypothetical protein